MKEDSTIMTDPTTPLPTPNEPVGKSDTLTPHTGYRRDRFAHWAGNLMLRLFATRKYRAFLTVVSNLGLAELDRKLKAAGPGASPGRV